MNWTMNDANTLPEFEQVKKDFEERLNETLDPSDERLLFLQGIYLLLQSYNAKIEQGYTQRLLSDMTDDYLDEFGSSRGVVRNPAVAAVTKQQFRLQAVQEADIIIPAGTRVATKDQKSFFATDDDAIIPAGNEMVDVGATAVNLGANDNGLIAGQLVVIVDPVPYVAETTNIAPTTGGAGNESDEAYRERIRLEMAKKSTAGAVETYEFWARSASSDIIDVAVTSPSAGEVLLTPLMSGGELPGPDVLDDVLRAVNQDHIRPLTDNVNASAPGVVQYNIDLDYYVSPDVAETVKTAVEGSGGAIERYISWQKEALGRAINPGYLHKLLFEAGVIRADIRSPEYTDISTNEIAHVDAISANEVISGEA